MIWSKENVLLVISVAQELLDLTLLERLDPLLFALLATIVHKNQQLKRIVL